jgi:hypothetical protein
MKTITIKKAIKRHLLFLLLFGTFLTLNAQVQDSLTINSGRVASAIGFETQALGDYSFASGYQSVADGYCSFAFGKQATAINGNSIAMGYQANANGNLSLAIGQQCYSNTYAYSFGNKAKAYIDNAFAIGSRIDNHGLNSILIGGSSNPDFPLINYHGNAIALGINVTEPTFFIQGPSYPNSGKGKVGIGTTNPIARFQVADGDIFIQDIDKGIIMKSPDGNCWRGTMNNFGQLEFVKLADCENLTTKTNEETEINSIKVFPNPSKEYFEVRCSQADSQKYNTISIFGTTGNLIFSQPFNAGTTRISTTNFKSGSYILKLHGGQDSFSDILVITH